MPYRYEAGKLIAFYANTAESPRLRGMNGEPAESPPLKAAIVRCSGQAAKRAYKRS
ncbi:MAG: hypothetical protein QOH31_1359 [Verrucomicrobiota bacterium]|jgi:hypothetical protein